MSWMYNKKDEMVTEQPANWSRVFRGVGPFRMNQDRRQQIWVWFCLCRNLQRAPFLCLVRKTICFSKPVQMHDIVIGLFVNRYEFGSTL